MFPDSPYLLETDTKPLVGRDYIKKPILSREGANIEIISAFDEKIIAASEGSYGKEGYIYQELYKLPGDYNQNPVIGAWIIEGYPCGMGIREGGLITDNKSRFVPHVIVR
jgi:glutathionylspermidine synthase